MFEETEVCIQCGRPVDGRVYCSDECENLDGASPSLSSATSSAHPSPYVTSMKSSNLDVPALVPSTLGHRARYSISSSASSTAWSAVTTDEDEEDPYLYTENPDMLSDGSKSPGYGLFYARRPSSTNHRATVPMLHRHSSGIASSVSASASSFGMSRGLPSPFYASTEDDASSVCISELSLHEDDASARRKAKRTSLPAYFSLLQGSSVSSSVAASSSPRRTPSALHALSRSLHASPTTPKVSHATVVLTNAEAHIETTAATAATSPIARGRGRRRERDPSARSSSSRRSAARSPPRHLSAAQRARLDSVEKVAEWVSSSPVIALAGAGTARRNSSPQRKPKYEFVEALTRGLRDCAVASSSEDDDDEDTSDEKAVELSREDFERTIRGRRRVDELDEAYHGNAPGYGNGRSGLKARERGRGVASRAIGLALR
ncbi:hypothetical protein PsYK624_126520 [Phanerochaete sordida]|uniref:Uncharacterized protein n=1 Tax=Phanerochaete sordida TaxID=48140 RepID=A0A9P3GJS4_9APHY|nr:hypothetical protein PsYK624_126520 [Phanerochaete sordida]